MLDIIIRPEERADAPAIRAVIVAAFEDQPYSNHREHHIVDRLRESSALTVSLVAVLDAAVVGHIAFSPVTIGGKFCAWYGLGPLSVAPIHQRKGSGSRLVNAGLEFTQSGRRKWLCLARRGRLLFSPSVCCAPRSQPRRICSGVFFGATVLVRRATRQSSLSRRFHSIA